MSVVGRRSSTFAEGTLEAYLLPPLPFEEVLAIQQRLIFDLSAQPRDRVAVLLCEHEPVITVGRQGSRLHILDHEEDDGGGTLARLRAETGHSVPIRWTNRGGGCWFMQPGILAAYVICPIERIGLGGYRDRLYQVLLDVLLDFGLGGEWDRNATGIRVHDRQIASVGIACKQWIAYHGCYLNVNVPSRRSDAVRWNPHGPWASTSLFRERGVPVRMTQVRERFLHSFQRVFGFDTYYPCSPPPISRSKRALHVVTRNH